MELSDTVRRLAFAYKSHESAISIPVLEVLVRQPNAALQPRAIMCQWTDGCKRCWATPGLQRRIVSYPGDQCSRRTA
jgi:hypothetical protein